MGVGVNVYECVGACMCMCMFVCVSVWRAWAARWAGAGLGLAECHNPIKIAEPDLECSEVAWESGEPLGVRRAYRS